MQRTLMLTLTAVVIGGAFSVCAQPVYYPLRVGDTWFYRNGAIMPSDTLTYTCTAIADTIIAGRHYTAINDGTYSSHCERQSGDSVFVIRWGLPKEVQYFNFASAVGDTVSSTALGYDTMDVVLIRKGTGTFFGAQRRWWTFFIDTYRHAMDDEYALTVADSIGIVYRQPYFGDPMYLAGAVIDGKAYGRTLDVGVSLPEQPGTCELEQNFPNPFNPSTTIRYSVPARMQVTMNVFNMLGQEVGILQDGEVDAGFHEVHFDGAYLPSGVYFYRLSAGAAVETRRLLLLK